MTLDGLVFWILLAGGGHVGIFAHLTTYIVLDIGGGRERRRIVLGLRMEKTVDIECG